MFASIKYKVPTVNKKIMGTRNLNFLILNKFRNGAIMIKIKPIELLIKNLGYRDTLVQKSFIHKLCSYYII